MEQTEQTRLGFAFLLEMAAPRAVEETGTAKAFRPLCKAPRGTGVSNVCCDPSDDPSDDQSGYSDVISQSWHL